MSSKLVYHQANSESLENIQQCFSTQLSAGYVKCKGVGLPQYFPQFGDKIREMNIRSDDIWVCSYPKTGTTWTQEMVWCIAHEVNLKTAEEDLSKRFPFLEFCSFYDKGDWMSKNIEMTIPDYMLDSFNYTNELPSPRFVKTHLSFELLPEKLQQFKTDAKIVYVARNARDTCVSYFNHYKIMDGYLGSFEQFCELFLQGEVIYGSFWDHILGYWKQRNNPNVLILKYEDMKKDLTSTIVKVANFLGKTLNEEQIANLLDHLSFQSMKENQAVNFKSYLEFCKKYSANEEEGSFLRCGKVGEWKATMNTDLMERFKSRETEHQKETGLFFLT